MPQPSFTELAARRATALAGGQVFHSTETALTGLTARQRLARLLDEGSFFEFDPFLTRREDRYADAPPPDGVVAGFGKIEGRRVAVFAQDRVAGAFSEMGAQKTCQLIERAREGGLPILGLYDSAGPAPEEGAYGLAGPAELLWQQTQASGLVLQLALGLGPAPGALALSVGLADFVIAVAGEGQVFLEPETLPAAADTPDLEILGGAALHSRESGLVHLLAADEIEALTLARQLLGYLPSNNLEAPPYRSPTDDPWRMEVALDTLVPDDPALAYDMRAVLEAVFDRGSLFEIQAGFAQNVIVGLARLHGATVGIVAQQPMVLAGVLDIDASDKIARFVRTCDAFNIPLITFVDSPGFLPGVAQEHGGIIRHGAKIVYAYSEASVPKISVVTRKAYGGAYIVMSSKYIRTDLCLAWPNAEIAVLGAGGAVNILYRKQLQQAADAEATRARLVHQFAAQFGTPFRPAASGHVDDIIKPGETRPRLIAALEMLKDKRVVGPGKKHGNMPM
ncbi:MAG: acyl-CoA carboxylase subunit beta [Chloroflexota bacterium]